VYLLPDEVSFEEATFIEPLACVLRAQKRAKLQPGSTVLILGSGIGGMLHIHLARVLGAARVIATDISEYRLKKAKRFGADEVINAKEDVASKLKTINGGKLADSVIVCTGAVSAINQALQSVERGGTILFFAPTDRDATVPLSINELFWRNDVTLATSYAGDRADHLTALQLIKAKRVTVEDMITHKLSLSETGLGFDLVAKAQDSIKVIIEPQR
jgi:L-iditol 2-dehydrogenase